MEESKTKKLKRKGRHKRKWDKSPPPHLHPEDTGCREWCRRLWEVVSSPDLGTSAGPAPICVDTELCPDCAWGTSATADKNRMLAASDGCFSFLRGPQCW